MKVLKGFAFITAFSSAFLFVSGLFGFFAGVIKAFLSYFCIIGISADAVNHLSGIIFTFGLLYLLYWIYLKFFR